MKPARQVAGCTTSELHAFPLVDILSLVTGVLLGSMDGMRQVMDWVLGAYVLVPEPAVKPMCVYRVGLMLPDINEAVFLSNYSVYTLRKRLAATTDALERKLLCEQWVETIAAHLGLASGETPVELYRGKPEE